MRMGIARRIVCRQSCLAFTLTELLAVIAVVAILAALLLSVLGQAKKKGGQAQCIHNIRQLNIGLADFVAEHNEFPLDGNLSKGFFIWQRAVSIKLYGEGKGEEFWPKNRQVFDCPSEKSPAYHSVAGPFYDYGYNSFGVGNETNSLGLSGENSANFKPVAEAEIANPSGMITVGDGFWGGGRVVGDGTSTLRRLAGASPTAEQIRRAGARHNRSGSVGFADGHAEALSFDALFGDDSDAALARWNRDHQPHRESLR